MIWLGEGPGWARAGALLIGLASQELIWSVRPHLFSLSLLVLVLILRPARRFHWLYPLMFLLWANLHAGVAFGGGVLGIVCLVAFMRDGAGWYAIGRGYLNRQTSAPCVRSPVLYHVRTARTGCSCWWRVAWRRW